MTEAEWLESEDPESMLTFLRQSASDRKLRLCAAQFCLAYFGEYPDDQDDWTFRFATEISQSGALPDSTIEPKGEYLPSILLHESSLTATLGTVKALTSELRNRSYSRNMGNPDFDAHAWYDGFLLADKALRDSYPPLLRDIFGNPLRPVSLDPSWLTSTVVGLAGGIYEERAFDRLPILADALMDAGCDHPDILAHCRGEGPHVRGCWVVDLLLGKT